MSDPNTMASNTPGGPVPPGSPPPNPAVQAALSQPAPEAEKTEKAAKAPKEPKAPPPPPTPVPAQATPLADRNITAKKLERLSEALKACMEDFETIRKTSDAPKGVAILAGRGALPHDQPDGYQAISLAQEVIKGRRVSGTLFSSRLKNLLIQQYSPMLLGAWLVFNK